jgi:hypothetical protein
MQSIYFSLFSLLLLGLVQANVSFNSTLKDADFDGRVPVNSISAKCAEAYAAPLKCTDHLFRLRDEDKGPKLFNNNDLGLFCTSDCIDSLNAWDMKLQAACSEADKLLVEDPTGSVKFLSMALEDKHSVQENLYWAFCLKDEYDLPLPPSYQLALKWASQAIK